MWSVQMTIMVIPRGAILIPRPCFERSSGYICTKVYPRLYRHEMWPILFTFHKHPFTRYLEQVN